MKQYSTEEIINVYHEAANDVACFIGKLEAYRDKFDYISNQTMDNADPLCASSKCLEELGILLSTLVIYENEYREDLNKKDEGKK